MTAAQARRKYPDDWENSMDAMKRIEAALEELEEYPWLSEETACLREQLEHMEKVCAGERSGKKDRTGERLPGGDPRTAARSLIARLPLREIFRDRQLSDAFLSELMLELARESSRESRREQQRKGIAAAKAQGVQFGKPSRPVPENFEPVRRAWREGQLSLKEAAKACAMPQSTFYGMAQRVEEAAREAESTPETVRRHTQQPRPQAWAG